MDKKSHGEFTKYFGINVFNDEARKAYLSKDAYLALKEATIERKGLEPKFANEVANGLMKWALDKGATHYTHWFQPLNGLTAEKHDAFIGKPSDEGTVSFDFKGKELIQGEPDASSFPSGGLRATFEARGYTIWDAESPAFVLEDEYGAILYIPTAFCSYNGEALDAKTPLLRSEDYLNEAVLRLLNLLGDNKATRIYSYAGAEQEYFLIESEDYLKRKDLVYTGRTLFGQSAPKGQELDDHYFGPIREKINSFMQEVNENLWKLGIAAKTEHNEVAPSQHELACIYAPSSLASDQNQLVMRLLKRIAKRHGMVCLLAEKPFAGINGSGKHNNWSVGTDNGINLLAPGNDEKENIRFLIFLAAILRGVDIHADLLRESVASYGNDFRLGADEAPPAILSVYLGDTLTNLINETLRVNSATLSKTKKGTINGSKALPTLEKDDADRNRTSPFAFTGNRFEFRMVGSEQNIAEANTFLNALLGEGLNEAASYLEGKENKEEAAKKWIKETIAKHERIIFNGDGYSKDWELEAQKRGLPNLKTTPEAISSYAKKVNFNLLISSGILSEKEISSRQNIKYEDYHNKALIEAKTMSRMAHKLYLPAIHEALRNILEEEKLLTETFLPTKETKEKLMKVLTDAYSALETLDQSIEEEKKIKGDEEKAFFASKNLKIAMQNLRAPIDKAELLVPKKLWPVPTYGDLLFHI